MKRLVLVSNRVVLPSEQRNRSGGLAVVINASLRGSALWFGWSGRISQTPELTRCTRGTKEFLVSDVSQAEYDAYYTGFSNSCVYPLLLYRPDLLRFDAGQYVGYLNLCERFAKVLEPELRSDDLVWVHDNQLLSIIRFLKSACPDLRYGFFLHLPFPPSDVFETLPVARELLTDWLKYDVVGFQSQSDCQNFVQACQKIVGAEIVDENTVQLAGHQCKVIANPVGIRPDRFAALAERQSTARVNSLLRDSLAGRKLIIGAERLDYSKGLHERFESYHNLFKKYPEHRRNVSYLQIASESRQDVRDYRDLKTLLDRDVGALNGAHSDVDWVPLRYVTRSMPRPRLAAYFRAAKVGLVTPLRDGFNLVSEEYLTAQDSADPGVLILSKFAGAAELLGDAVIVNPFDVVAVTDAIHLALNMPLVERKSRWNKLMKVIHANPVERWFTRFLGHLEGKTSASDGAPLGEINFGDWKVSSNLKGGEISNLL